MCVGYLYKEESGCRSESCCSAGLRPQCRCHCLLLPPGQMETYLQTRQDKTGWDKIKSKWLSNTNKNSSNGWCSVLFEKNEWSCFNSIKNLSNIYFVWLNQSKWRRRSRPSGQGALSWSAFWSLKWLLLTFVIESSGQTKVVFKDSLS